MARRILRGILPRKVRGALTMLVPFVIDADSIAPDPSWSPAQILLCHEALLSIWSHIGLLLLDGGAQEEALLYRELDRLPPKPRGRWIDTLKYMPILFMGSDWDGKVRPDRLRVIAGRASVALVEDAHAEVSFGLAEDELSTTGAATEGIEICRLAAAAQAARFSEALTLSKRPIEIGETFRDIWIQRFRRLAAAPIKQVCIVDRYAVGQHFAPGRSYDSGLARFFHLLDEDACGDRYITLYSAWTPEIKDKDISDVERELRFILKNCSRGRIKRATVYMLPNAVFGKMSHDRFIRFGDRHGWDLGLGLKILEGAFCSEKSRTTFKTGVDIDSYRETEDALRKDPQVKSVIVKGSP